MSKRRSMSKRNAMKLNLVAHIAPEVSEEEALAILMVSASEEESKQLHLGEVGDDVLEDVIMKEDRADFKLSMKQAEK
eukprot:3021136-Amphidinium_carterae.1